MRPLSAVCEWVECFARLGLLHFQNHATAASLPEQRVHGFFGWLKASEGMNEIENEEWAGMGILE